MKDFFKKKKNIWTMVGILLTIILFAISVSNSPEGNIAELDAVGVLWRCVSALSFSLFLPLVSYLFFNKQTFWAVFIPMFIFLTLQIVLEFAFKYSIGTAGIILSIVMGAFFIWGFIGAYNKNKHKINGTLPIKKKKEEDDDDKSAEELETLIAEEDEKFKEEIKFIEKSFVLSAYGSIYQVIKNENKLYFHRVGNFFRGIKNESYIREFEDLEKLVEGKKDFILNLDQIDDIKISLWGETSPRGVGKMSFIHNGQKYKYEIMLQSTHDQLKSFWGEAIQIQEIVTKEELEDKEETTDEHKEKLHKLNKALLIFSLASTVVLDIWFFFNNKYLNPFLTPISVAICLTPLVLYIVFNDYLSIYYSQPTKKKISVLMQLFTFPCVMLIKNFTTADFLVYYDYLKFFLIALGVFAVLYVLIIFTTKERKKFKAIYATLAFILLFISPGAVVNLNSSLDFSKPKEVASLVVDKPTHTDNDGEVTYYLTVQYKNKNRKCEVNKDVYDKYEKESEIILVRYAGAFGIEKVLIKDYAD